jgi:ubiquinone/menaquinone biosynthesis C-methylase UbiE
MSDRTAGFPAYDRAKRAAIAGLRGTVLEIGAGRGRNLGLLPSGITWIGVEPDPGRRRRLGAAARRFGHDREPLAASAEDLPLPDDSADFVVATFVLCTVSDPQIALQEIARVLKPGGRFVFMEHVRSRDSGLAAWQDRMQPVWGRFAYGCHCNRPTPETIDAFDGLHLDDVRRDSMPRAVPVIRPLAIGTATAS